MRFRTCRLKSFKKSAGSGGEGEVSMPPLNNFSKFFFQKNSNFCDITELDF